MGDTEAPRYEQLADDIETEIAGGIFFDGDRLYSIRECCEKFHVSMTTAIQAYRLLEDRGIIEARPQSGFYVRRRTAASDNELCSPLSSPVDSFATDSVMQIMNDSVNPSLLQFGAALPDPELLPSAKIARHLAEVAKDKRYINSYGIPEGVEELRVQIARKQQQNNCSISASEIVVTNGCMEAIYISLSAVCQPGDLVAVEAPTYFCIFKTLQSLGLRAIEIPTHRRDGVSIDALRFALEHHPIKACLFITNFSNPLGHVMPDENKRELAALVAEKNITLIEDDTWGELYYTEQRPRTVKSFDRSGNVILCSSFSKDIAPSVRVGWCAPGKWRDAVARVKLSLNVGTSILPQMTIARFLSTGGYDHHLRSLRRTYHSRVRALAAAVRRHFPEGTRLNDPAGGFVLWVEMPKGIDAMRLYQMAIEKGMTIAPGPMFSATGAFANCIRLNAALWKSEDEESIAQLGACAKKLLKGT